jgi:probable F420-dependent oxidoreductase
VAREAQALSFLHAREVDPLEVWAAVDDVRMPLAKMPAHAQRAERLGFDGLIVPEAVYDAIPSATLALASTQRLRVATGVIVAFARSPMLVAQDSWALAQLSGGRFAIGLGPQVKGNVEGRFGMPWSAPAERMRDYVGALRACFDTFQTGKPLAYASESYSLSRMQPFFKPDPLPPEHAHIPVCLGAIGPLMTQVAGEVADCVIAHPTNSSPAYLRDRMRPRLVDGAAKAGREAGAVRVIANPMVATGPDPTSVAREREAAREVLAFTYSTPAYWGTLEHHGWGDVGRALLEKTRAGDWAGMRALISDEMLDALVPSAPFDEVATRIRARYAGIADGISLRMPGDPEHDAAFARVVAELRSA